MTITIYLLDPTGGTTTPLPTVINVESEGFDTDGNYTVTGSSVAHIIPTKFLYRVEKDF